MSYLRRAAATLLRRAAPRRAARRTLSAKPAANGHVTGWFEHYAKHGKEGFDVAPPAAPFDWASHATPTTRCFFDVAVDGAAAGRVEVPRAASNVGAGVAAPPTRRRGPPTRSGGRGAAAGRASRADRAAADANRPRRSATRIVRGVRER